jgi:hypothetical protein
LNAGGVAAAGEHQLLSLRPGWIEAGVVGDERSLPRRHQLIAGTDAIVRRCAPHRRRRRRDIDTGAFDQRIAAAPPRM